MSITLTTTALMCFLNLQVHVKEIPNWRIMQVQAFSITTMLRVHADNSNRTVVTVAGFPQRFEVNHTPEMIADAILKCEEELSKVPGK